jgi:hypothetical protein
VVQARENCSLAQKLLAGFCSNSFRESAVILDFFQRALAALEPGVVGKIDRAHSALTDPIKDLVAAAQHLPVLDGWEQRFSLGLLIHNVSERSVSALVLHRNASLCYIIINCLPVKSK